MSKRDVTFITKKIEELDRKLSANRKEIATWELQREKYLEMLELVAPKSDLPPQPADDTTQATQPEGESSPASLETKKSAFHEKLQQHKA